MGRDVRTRVMLYAQNSGVIRIYNNVIKKSNKIFLNLP